MISWASVSNWLNRSWHHTTDMLKATHPTANVWLGNCHAELSNSWDPPVKIFILTLLFFFTETNFEIIKQKNWSACCLQSKKIANLAKFRNAIVVQPDPVRAKCVQFLLASCRRCLCRFRPKKIWLCFSNTTYLPSTRSVFCSVWKKR